MIKPQHSIRSISRRALVIATLGAAGFAGCSTDSNKGAGGGTMIISSGADAGTLDPLVVQDQTGRMLVDLLFDHLADIGDDMNTLGDAGWTPRLAKSWDWSKDSLSITFHIDPAARWHDGAKVTANDVRYTMSAIRDTTIQSPSAPVTTNIDSIHVADSLTAVVYFKRHVPEEFYDVAYQLWIVPEHIYAKLKPAEMRTSEVLRKPVGSGRFRFVRWEAGSRIELIADTANYKGRAKLDRLVLLLGQSPEASATAVLTAESDFYEAFPVDQAARLDSSKVARGIANRQFSYGFLGMRLRDRKSKTKPHPIFSDLAVRRAIAMSLERPSMLANVFNGHGILGHGPFPAGAATADTSLRVPPFDTARAKALLDSAGWKAGANGMRTKNGRPLRFELMFPATSSIRSRYGDQMQEQLRRVGIQVDLAKIPAPNFFGRQDQGDFDATLSTISTDPGVSGTSQYWATGSIQPGTNLLAYSNPRVDALLDSAGHVASLAALKPIAARAYQTIIDDAPAVWLYNGFTLTAVNQRIKTQPYRADGWWNHLADWSIPPSERIDRDRLGLSTKTP